MRDKSNRQKNEEYLAFIEEFMQNKDRKEKQVAPQNNILQKTEILIGNEEKNSSQKLEIEQHRIVNDQKNQRDDYYNTITELFIDDMPYSIGTSSIIGKRKNQQDSVIIPDDRHIQFEDDNAKFICALSDGMGGLAGGEIASNIATNVLFKTFYKTYWDKKSELPYLNFFSQTADKINYEILKLEDEEGNLLKAGATIIAVIVDKDKMHFLNIGDSRIYLIRNNRIVCLTHDQNYLSVLMNKVKSGKITQEEALSDRKKEALISYLGIKELKIKEINLKPIELMQNDVVLLCSDGLYRLLSENEMADIVSKTSNDMNLAAYKLTAAATAKNNRGQDNTSVILIKFN